MEKLGFWGIEKLGEGFIAELDEDGGEELIAVDDDSVEVGEVGFSEVGFSQHAESDCAIQLGVFRGRRDRQGKWGFQLVLDEEKCFSERGFRRVVRFVGGDSKQLSGVHVEFIA